MKLHSAEAAEIREGRVTDVYFRRTRRILEVRGVNPEVRAEFVAKSLPEGREFAVLAGVEEALSLCGDLGLDARGMEEGSLFGPLEPVLEVRGPYRDFCEFETALLGFLCQASGVATRAAACRVAAGSRSVISFGARRLHPSVAPVVERAAYLGGCDGVATLAGAERIGSEPVGTMPHALMLVLGDTVEAALAFHEVIEEGVPRIVLIDTFRDEKFEAVRVAEALGDALEAVRLDTPSTRRGDFFRLLEEVRWELDLRGRGDVGLFASGGLGEEELRTLNPVADGYGVGGFISGAPVVDFAMDIVEIEGRPVAKRGKWSGAKQVTRCAGCGRRRIRPLVAATDALEACPDCGGEAEPVLVPLLEGGEPVRPAPDPTAIRERVLGALAAGIGIAPEGAEARERPSGREGRASGTRGRGA